MRYFQYQQTVTDFWRVIDSRLQERRETLKHMCETLEIPYMTLLHQRNTREVYPKWEQACIMAVYLGIPLDQLALSREGRKRIGDSNKYQDISDIADWLLTLPKEKLDSIRLALGVPERKTTSL